jgi:phage baseplate assembly protein W
MATLYKGFSTYNRSKKFRVTDFDLVKQDLINIFNIRKGEKLMQPDFGTIIWGLLFEPLTDNLRQAVIDDVTRIVNYDPRISVENISLNEKDYGLQIEIDLVYIQTNQTDTLSLNFDKNQNTIATGQ